MEPNPVLNKLLKTLPSLRKANRLEYTWKAICPFHEETMETLYINMASEETHCMKCHYHASTDKFFQDMEQQQTRVERKMPINPNDSFSPMYVEEVCGEVYKLLFLKKVNQLVKAVEQLEKLIARMKK